MQITDKKNFRKATLKKTVKILLSLHLIYLENVNYYWFL